MMRVFHLVRDEDTSGVSGTGIVAEGVEFSDGACVLHWLGPRSSTTVFASLEKLIEVHGHGARTRVEVLGRIDRATPAPPRVPGRHTRGK